MGRKAVHLIAAAKHPGGREVIWAAIRKLRRFTVLQIEGETRVNMGTIRTYVTGLTRAGYLRLTNDPQRRGRQHVKGVWELVRDVGVEAPRVTRHGAEVTQGRARTQMWRTMRIAGDFTARELAYQASTEDCLVKQSDAKSYVQFLRKAGYLMMVKARPAAVYRLLASRYTGPKAPQVQRVQQVFDPNLGRVVWPVQART